MNKLKEPPSNADTDEPSDIDLVNRSKEGDLDAFDELVTRYRGKVYALILNMVHNDADAWDLAQEAFVKAWKGMPRFEARSNFYTWLYRIAHNVTYDWMRRKKVRNEGVEFDDRLGTDLIDPGSRTTPHGSRRPDQEAENSELRLKIESAIEKLSPDHQAVILLKEVEGMKYHEIAEKVDCSIGTVMSRLFYARKRLQSLLEDAHPA